MALGYWVGVDWAAVINNDKKENDMSEIDVRVGDVWLDEDGDELNVFKIHGDRAAIWYITTGRGMIASTRPLGTISCWKLIERDGKKMREFEEDGWYPVSRKIGSLSVRLRQYRNGRMKDTWGNEFAVSLYSWIGEKINLQDLK